MTDSTQSLNASDSTQTLNRCLVIAYRRDQGRRLLPDDVSIGWRVICQDGSPYDVFWGSTTDEHIDGLVANVRAEHAPDVIDLLDLRNKPDEIRDSRYYSTPR